MLQICNNIFSEIHFWVGKKKNKKQMKEKVKEVSIFLTYI